MTMIHEILDLSLQTSQGNSEISIYMLACTAAIAVCHYNKCIQNCTYICRAYIHIITYLFRQSKLVFHCSTYFSLSFQGMRPGPGPCGPCGPPGFPGGSGSFGRPIHEMHWATIWWALMFFWGDWSLNGEQLPGNIRIKMEHIKLLDYRRKPICSIYSPSREHHFTKDGT